MGRHGRYAIVGTSLIEKRKWPDDLQVIMAIAAEGQRFPLPDLQHEVMIEAVENGRYPDPALIQELADDAASRTFLYVVLDGHDKLDLFPEKYDNFISSAEAALVYWLLHPNELGVRPEKIKFMKKVEIVHEIKEKEEKLQFYVFKFKEKAAEGEWEAGVAGPYVASSNPYDFAPGTFSLFETYDSKSPKEHAESVHELCLKKKMY